MATEEQRQDVLELHRIGTQRLAMRSRSGRGPATTTAPQLARWHHFAGSRSLAALLDRDLEKHAVAAFKPDGAPARTRPRCSRMHATGEAPDHPPPARTSIQWHRTRFEHYRPRFECVALDLSTADPD